MYSFTPQWGPRNNPQICPFSFRCGQWKNGIKEMYRSSSVICENISFHHEVEERNHRVQKENIVVGFVQVLTCFDLGFAGLHWRQSSCQDQNVPSQDQHNSSKNQIQDRLAKLKTSRQLGIRQVNLESRQPNPDSRLESLKTSSVNLLSRPKVHQSRSTNLNSCKVSPNSRAKRPM